MKTVNKSGASDYKGVTTKVTSFLYSRSIVLRSYFYQLFKLICFTGHIPVRLKIDKICFLWKWKGSVLDPAMYRPITHAPAVGKHLEKLAQTFLNSVDDGNSTNHAYVAQHKRWTEIATKNWDVKLISFVVASWTVTRQSTTKPETAWKSTSERAGQRHKAAQNLQNSGEFTIGFIQKSTRISWPI